MDIVYPIFSAMILSNLLMLGLGFALLPLTSNLAYVKKEILVPIIAVSGILGSFTVTGSLYEVGIAVFFGILGYIMERYGFPVAPLCLSLILGPIAENSLRQSMIISRGDVTIFFTRPISLILIIVTIVSVVYLVIQEKRGLRLAEE
jgi:putative tricarboxylic transport membrane protein